MRKPLAGIFTLAVVSFVSHSTVAQSGPPLLLRFPTVSKTQIVFNYGGDLWIVGRDGGEARLLTSAVGDESVPHFSPDGTRSRLPANTTATWTYSSFQPLEASRGV